MNDVSQWSAVTIALAFLAWGGVIIFASTVAFILFDISEYFRTRKPRDKWPL